LLAERFGFGVLPDLLEKDREVIQGIGGYGFLAPSALCHFDGPFRNGYRLLIFSFFNLIAFGR
jgi:hypothetical protein